MNNSEKNIVIFNSRDLLLRIDIDKIVYFEADGNYTNIVTVNKLPGAAVGMNLGKVEAFMAEQLGSDASQFLRLGKRFIINLDYVYQINVQRQFIVLSDYDHFAYKVGVSKDALKKLKQIMVSARR